MSRKLEFQANRIEAVLALHRVSARVTGGTVTPRWIRFQVLPAPFFKDAGAVYVGKRLEQIPGADPASFTVLPAEPGTSFSPWAKDARRGYFYAASRIRPIEGIDFASFEALNRKHARDVGRVYFEEKVIEGADPGSFHVPKKHVHHVGRDNAGRYISGRLAE